MRTEDTRGKREKRRNKNKATFFFFLSLGKIDFCVVESEQVTNGHFNQDSCLNGVILHDSNGSGSHLELSTEKKGKKQQQLSGKMHKSFSRNQF